MIDTKIQTIDSVLSRYREALGQDYFGYRNHCYRVSNFSKLFDISTSEYQLVSSVAAFHDLGIWTNKTFDYIDHSINLMKLHHAMQSDAHDLLLSIEMIKNHHKIFSLDKSASRLVEVLRKCDWIDITFGVRNFGINRKKIREILSTFPNSGFHKYLLRLSAKRIKTNPFDPFPMMKL